MWTPGSVLCAAEFEARIREGSALRPNVPEYDGPPRDPNAARECIQQLFEAERPAVPLCSMVVHALRLSGPGRGSRTCRAAAGVACDCCHLLSMTPQQTIRGAQVGCGCIGANKRDGQRDTSWAPRRWADEDDVRGICDSVRAVGSAHSVV